jgi:regulator of cell morphogenesis and NO signaling
MNPIASLTLREVIRSRPLAIGVLEEKAGASFWNRLDAPLEEFSRETDLDLAGLGHAIASLPENLERKDWAALPLYYLIDYLTSGHRLFRTRDLPEVHRLLDNLRIEFPAGNESLETLLREFTSFRREFAWHMEEEEEFLFPKILRIEASLRHPELYPEVFKGSIRIFSAQQLQGPEQLFHDLISDLSQRLNGLVSDALDLAMAREALAAMHGHEASLKAHAFLEMELLFPRALAMEASLLQRGP